MEDMIGHRVHRTIEELEYGKIGTRENSGDPGGKTTGQIHQGTLGHSAHYSDSRERAFECPHLGHMPIPCTEETEHCLAVSTRAVSFEGMRVHLPGESRPRQAKERTITTQHYGKPVETAAD